jgi:TPR repeat protein
MNFTHISIIILMTTLLSGCLSMDEKDDDDNTPSAQEAQELALAQQAFEAGNYREATTKLFPLAQGGNPEAQYALGFALYEGLGVPQDRMQAYFWIQEAARQGNPSALLALEVFELDPNLPLDDDVL